MAFSSTICRICTQDYLTISYLYDGETVPNVDRYFECALPKYASVQIGENDELPKTVCNACKYELQRVMKFIRLMEKSDTILRIRLKMYVLEQFEKEFVADDNHEEISSSMEPMDTVVVCDDDSNESSTDIKPKCEEVDSSIDIVNHHLSEPEPDIYNENITIESFKVDMDKNDKPMCSDDSGETFDLLIDEGEANSKLDEKAESSAQPPVQTCEACNKDFRYLIDFIQHVKKHTGKLPFKCNICDKYFAYRDNLLKHYKIHKCNTCGKQYAHKKSIETHKSMHSLICHICEHKSNTEIEAKTHKKIHLNHKTFHCEVCKKEFVVFSAFRKHRLKH